MRRFGFGKNEEKKDQKQVKYCLQGRKIIIFIEKSIVPDNFLLIFLLFLGKNRTFAPSK